MPVIPWAELEALQLQRLVAALLVRILPGAYAGGPLVDLLAG